MDICTCGLVKQSRAGTEVREGVEYCNACGLPATVASVSQARSEPQGASVSAGPTGNVRNSVEAAANRAESAAGTLEGTATVLLVLSVLGGLIFVVMGFTNKVCPGGAFDCYTSDMVPDSGLIGLGVASILLWAFIWALAQAVAMRLRLAAAVARRG